MTRTEDTPAPGTAEQPTIPAIELRDVSKSFGSVTAVRDANLTIYPGQIAALVGENGAGKSTLTKIISGAERPDRGTVLIDGREVRVGSPTEARHHGIEMVYQDLALVETMDVAANFYLGRESLRHGLLRPSIDKRTMRKKTTEVLAECDIHLPSTRTLVRNLSGGQRQGIAIGRALNWGAKVILLDEPTAALGVAETQHVEDMIRGIKRRNIAILLVSHTMDQIFRLTDRIYVIRHGQIVGKRDTSQTTPEEIVGMITGLRH
ncbi:MAG: sugar ABC transporter ATP-binding protein [Mycobacterium sp.]|nr:sugar ABC transporter ATP-binding protein [Mycobacterium sp.]